jgi:hypothetical protein
MPAPPTLWHQLMVAASMLLSAPVEAARAALDAVNEATHGAVPWGFVVFSGLVLLISHWRPPGR